jgi:hypothetical protein
LGTFQKNKTHKIVYVDWIGISASWTSPAVTAREPFSLKIEGITIFTA